MSMWASYDWAITYLMAGQAASLMPLEQFYFSQWALLWKTKPGRVSQGAKVTWTIRAKVFTGKIQGTIRHLPSDNFSKTPASLGRERAPVDLSQACSAWHHGTFGRWGQWRRQHVRMLCYRRGTLFPWAHAVICLICLWVEVGRGEGCVQSPATEKSHEVIGVQGFPHWPVAAIVFPACVPRGSPPLPWRVLILGFLLWTYIFVYPIAR